MISVALIGHGYWGSKILKYLTLDKNFSLKAICDSKTDMSKVWPKVEAVIVVTPVETHYQVIKQALLQGKHVFSEKPLTLKAEECQELKEIAKKNNLVLAVEYTQTFSRSLKFAAKKIDVGKIQAIEMSVKHLGRFLNLDVYWLLASHCLSILDMFIPLKNFKFEKKDFVACADRVETGLILFNSSTIRGQIFLSLNFPGKEYRIIIYGQKGTIIYNSIEEPTLKTTWYKKTKKLLPDNLITEEKTWNFDEKNNLKFALDFFYRVIRGKEKTNLDRAIKVTEILERLS